MKFTKCRVCKKIHVGKIKQPNRITSDMKCVWCGNKDINLMKSLPFKLIIMAVVMAALIYSCGN